MAIIEQVEVTTLREFYALMEATRQVRFAATCAIDKGDDLPSGCVASLKNALASLEAIPRAGDRWRLSLGGGKSMELDLDYEINETRKDILFLEQGEVALMNLLTDMHPNFMEYVRDGVQKLGGLHYNCFITDRDGTTNNYCGRYRSSIQSVYNAVLLTRFARHCAKYPVVLTSAPLKDVGLVDVSVAPENAMFYAASKGREFLDLSGNLNRFPVDGQKQALLDTLNERLSVMVNQPEYEQYSLIGSGLQFKFGQTTIARQDIGNSIDAAESEAFLKTLGELVDELDPEGLNFRIEDTGLDVEIILTIDAGDSGPKDFDKGDGVRFLNDTLKMGMNQGPHLICGDTGSDVPMLEAALALSPDTRAMYVTQKEDLADRVRGLQPDAVIVPEPDMLVTILGSLPEA